MEHSILFQFSGILIDHKIVVFFSHEIELHIKTVYFFLCNVSISRDITFA